MSFVSYRNNRENHIVVDSELGEIKLKLMDEVDCAAIEIALVKVYIENDLPVGRNIALATIYWHKILKQSISHYTEWQDKYCPAHIPNWSQYAKERDEHLEKLLPLL